MPIGWYSSSILPYLHVSNTLPVLRAILISIFEVVAALRVHVLSGGSWCWVLPVWLLGMVPVGTNIVSTLSMTRSNIVAPDPTNMACHSSNWMYGQVVIINRASVIVSDILVVAATWYYISHTCPVRGQLICDVWAARPNLTTVMFRDGTLYFITISLLNLIDLVAYSLASMCVWIHKPLMTHTEIFASYRMSSILISRFLICICEAAERSTLASSSQSLSFVESKGNSVPHRWLSSIEFAADIANSSAEGNHADVFLDLDDIYDSLDSGGEEESQVPEKDENGVEMDEYARGGQQQLPARLERDKFWVKRYVQERMSAPSCPVPVYETMLSISCMPQCITGWRHCWGLLIKTRSRETPTATEMYLEHSRVGTDSNIYASGYIVTIIDQTYRQWKRSCCARWTVLVSWNRSGRCKRWSWLCRQKHRTRLQLTCNVSGIITVRRCR
ncbi:hypothetical protein POSPLADRAFT_1128165 [Postia placenta MAD-698-R-SB12]|uniref:Uncharacterized protein n=1 Tax=Postia placenta MAD-698-R-SB12 TaxID=670580 RepID=A0A1X6NI24_9APHY|nr:hypothetical protein POSPLADRAFT_1128165 [Postia placenta MAD-698-R-SB12]OSX68202.1 hypothetical protein POSPLADRAFT_1128165 [Postia placenta MAD-698-R-SB12]